MSVPELCVICNPMAGRRRAVARLDRLKRQWGARADFWPTQHPGHAEELACQAAHAGFAIVAAAGGDGTVHEVANGLLRSDRPDVVFGVAPIGSANDFAYSLRHDGYPYQYGVREVDVGMVRNAAGRQRYFVCGLGLGLNGAVTLESRRIKRLQGIALYGLATLRALWNHYACPELTITIDEGLTWSEPALMLSMLVGLREGGFVMAPQAKLDDGYFDYVQAGALSRAEVLYFLPRLALAGPPKVHPKVRQGRCRNASLHSAAPLICHIDGEFFCLPEDNVRSLDIRLLPRRLRVQLIATD
jgi:diacylglycerol kinase family enzyme